jgi:hypothetical protein
VGTTSRLWSQGVSTVNRLDHELFSLDGQIDRAKQVVSGVASFFVRANAAYHNGDLPEFLGRGVGPIAASGLEGGVAGGATVLLDAGTGAVVDTVASIATRDAVGGVEGDTAAAEVGDARTVDQAGGCFVAGTLVHTKNGLVPIEQLQAGDFVLSQPELKGEQAYRRINDTFVFEDKSIFEVVCQDGHGRSESLLATPNHPFWVKEIGWTGAEYLEAGQVLELSDGRNAQITSVRDTGETQRVFNFEVDGFHTYYVGKLGVWVHNANCIRNKHLAGQLHPVTGVPFDANGFPDFSEWAAIQVEIKPTGIRYLDEQAANREAGLGGTPKGWTWHHHQNGTTMQLIPRSIHAKTGHTGGFSLWQN